MSVVRGTSEQKKVSRACDLLSLGLLLYLGAYNINNLQSSMGLPGYKLQRALWSLQKDGTDYGKSLSDLLL